MSELDPHTPVRLSRLLAHLGICSRREADEFLRQGLVLVDGLPVSTLGLKVLPTQRVELAAAALEEQSTWATLLLHKPIGFVSGQPEDNHRPAVELLTADRRQTGTPGPLWSPEVLRGLAPAGRLDIDSTGLLVLTQDGRLARQLTGDEGEIEKEYLVRVRGNLSASGLEKLREGLALDGRPLRRAEVDWLNRDQLRFVLREGRKRQIRRMCELVGMQVVGLKRVRIGQIRLGRLPEGEWRFLRPDEQF